MEPWRVMILRVSFWSGRLLPEFQDPPMESSGPVLFWFLDSPREANKVVETVSFLPMKRNGSLAQFWCNEPGVSFHGLEPL